MKKYLNKIKNNQVLTNDDIEEIFRDYIKYLGIDLDNLSGVECLIYHQQTLIEIEQYLLFFNKVSSSKIQYLISIYDSRIKEQFNHFSKQEKIKIATKYDLYELYILINDLCKESLFSYSIEEIKKEIKTNIDMDTLSNELRLLNNLCLICFDGFTVSSYRKEKLKKKKL